ncbi:hypothetical protein KM043_006307 [Ampulex compressa]|nr:hypothetical protein KM043_006307 [Ampulex compressa]
MGDSAPLESRSGRAPALRRVHRSDITLVLIHLRVTLQKDSRSSKHKRPGEREGEEASANKHHQSQQTTLGRDVTRDWRLGETNVGLDTPLRPQSVGGKERCKARRRVSGLYLGGEAGFSTKRTVVSKPRARSVSKTTGSGEVRTQQTGRGAEDSR